MQALFDNFKSISLLFLAHFTNQFSNSPPAAQSRSRICLCILSDDVVTLHHLRGCCSKEKKKRNQNNARSTDRLSIFKTALFI